MTKTGVAIWVCVAIQGVTIWRLYSWLITRDINSQCLNIELGLENLESLTVIALWTLSSSTIFLLNKYRNKATIDPTISIPTRLKLKMTK